MDDPSTYYTPLRMSRPFSPGAAAGGAGPATFVQGDVTGAAATDTTVTITTGSSVGAGNLIVVYVAHEGTTTSISVSDGGVGLTGLTKETIGFDDLESQFFYLLSSTAGVKTYTATFGATKTTRRIGFMEFSSAGGTWSFDVQNTKEAPTAGTAITTNTITTTGTNEVAIAGAASYSGGITFTSEQINAVAAGNVVETDLGDAMCIWCRLLTATFTGGEGAVTQNLSVDWVANICSFKAA